MMTENFWIVNKNMLTIPEFKQFYESDKSKNKHVSSQIMWAIAASEDLHEHNPYRHLIYEDRIKAIQINLLDKLNVKFEDYDQLAEVYRTYCMSTIDIMITTYKRRLEDRIVMLRSQVYTLENAKLLDDLLMKTTNLYSEYHKLEELAESERLVDTKVKGGRLESIAEEGLI